MTNPDKLFGRLGNRMFQMAYILAKEAKKEIPDIYVQDPAYFEEYSHVIKWVYGHGIKRIPNTVAIHVRRGDYVGNSFYVDLTKTDYYEDAIKYVDERNSEDLTYLVFSDDIEWCKEYFKQDRFKGYNFVYSTEKDPIEDMNLMAGCNTAVITANSSFSWWAGYLSLGMIIAPKDWYRDGIERTKCPSTWIRL